MGQFCRICGRTRPNERFSGGGHRTHVCRECQGLPSELRRAIEAHAEIEGFLHRQSHISEKNVARLKELSASKDPEVAERAAVMLEVARVAPFKRKRFGCIRAAHPELWQRMAAAELVWDGAEFDDPLVPGEAELGEAAQAAADEVSDEDADDELPF